MLPEISVDEGRRLITTSGGYHITPPLHLERIHEHLSPEEVLNHFELTGQKNGTRGGGVDTHISALLPIHHFKLTLLLGADLKSNSTLLLPPTLKVSISSF